MQKPNTARNQEIAALRKEGWTYRRIAERYGLHPHHVRSIVISREREEKQEQSPYWQRRQQEFADARKAREADGAIWDRIGKLKKKIAAIRKRDREATERKIAPTLAEIDKLKKQLSP